MTGLDSFVGQQPWMVGDVFQVTNRFNHPTAGLMRIDGEVVSFRCLTGHADPESIWAYAMRPIDRPIEPGSPQHLFVQWASDGPITVALADEKGIRATAQVKFAGHTPSEFPSLAADALGIREERALELVGLR